jgi:REP element-mobilizing transposase RayT
MHALISPGKNQCISDIMHLLKGESSFWINKNKKTAFKFEWQDDYYAVSVGISQIENLRSYIRNQVSHHRKTSFNDELDLMIKEYGLERVRD